MYTHLSFLSGILLSTQLHALPLSTQDLTDPTYGPIPGESSYYSTYDGTTDAFPANITKQPIMPTAQGPLGPDDVLFQNLLIAEWSIYSFYQQGVELFNTSAFVEAGFPNDTYARIIEIRDNEAGHLRLFQDKLSATSIKPGACQYKYGFTDATSYMAIQTYLEVSSMAFLTGLVLQANLDASKSALLAIGETESRHNTWSLMEVWNSDPFAGPSDTTYPYANHILNLINKITIPGTCPSANPPFPNPNTDLPVTLGFNPNSTTLQPGSPIEYIFPSEAPNFVPGTQYYSVAFHGLNNISVPFDVSTNRSTIPSEIEADTGLIILVLADAEGAPTAESVVAGPLIIIAQPTVVTSMVG